MSHTAQPNFSTLDASEEVYELLTCYAFARRYVAGKSVVHVQGEELGYGTGLLAQTARFVLGLADSPAAVERALAAYPAANASYERTELPKLPRPDGSLDAVVAFGILGSLEDPERLLSEAKRVLKPGGVLVASAPDNGMHVVGRGRRSGMHGAEFRELLERSFRHVRLYRLGTVVGGVVFADSEAASEAQVENAGYPMSCPSLTAGAPPARSLLAVCGNTGVPEELKRTYLLLDRDLRVFEHREDLLEDVDLLRDEVRRMQESEVQAFQDTLTLRGSEVNYLKTRLEFSEADANNLRKQLREIHESRAWRLLGLYRKLRSGTGR